MEIEPSTISKIHQKFTEQKSHVKFANTIKSPKTLLNYDAYLKKFMRYHNIVSYDYLLEGTKEALEERITNWIVEDKTITNRSKQAYLASIKHFYDMNRCSLPWVIILKYLGEQETTVKDRAYSETELLKMLNVANLREKVVLTILVSAGLRRQAVPDLLRKHLAKTDAGNYQITVYAGTKSQYKTYCSIECSKWIDAYLQFRVDKGEKLTNESPLIREEFDVNDSLRASRPKRATEFSIINIMRSLATRTGIRTTTHMIEGQSIAKASLRKEVMLTHGCRKHCNTMMAKAKVYPVYKEMLLGHSIGLDKEYLRPSDDEILREYLKAEPLLTVDPTSRQALKIEQLETAYKQDRLAQVEYRLMNKLRKHILTLEAEDKDYQEIAKELDISEIVVRQWFADVETEEREGDTYARYVRDTAP